MPVVKLPDGTYQVGNMTFATAEQAFAHDNAQQAIETPSVPPVRPSSVPKARTGTQWSRMSTSSQLGAIAASVIFLAVVWGAVQAFTQSGERKQQLSKVAAPAPPAIAATPAPPPPPTPPPSKPLQITPVSAWRYDSSVDPMTGKKSSSAAIVSTNSLNFDFPYRGNNPGVLVVRQHPQYGLDVILSIEQGQILCNSYNCGITVRFDDGQPVKFGGTEPADHSSTSLFINQPKKFIAAASKAKTVLIQFNAYQNGSPVLEFWSPVPLEWPSK